MTSEAPARPVVAVGGRTLPRPSLRLLMPAVILGASLLTRGFSQAVTPFIRHDDWPYLMPG